MKAVLQYTNVIHDTSVIFNTLNANNIEILKITSGVPRPKITIRVGDHKTLLNLMYELNKKCVCNVSVVKTISEKFFIDFIKAIFE